MMSLLQFIIKILLLFLFAACSSVPRFTDSRNISSLNKNITEEENLSVYKNRKVITSEVGVASFYAHKFHGRKTANGETYDMYGLSAAHPTYPLGTIIKITNLSNGLSVIVKINDRMPQHPERIIDLSLGTADAIEMVTDGIQTVRVDVLEWGTGKSLMKKDLNGK